nr:hypothetical protein [Streptococcus anginosus]
RPGDVRQGADEKASGGVEPLSDPRKHRADDNQRNTNDSPTQFATRAVFTQPEDTERGRNQNAELRQSETGRDTYASSADLEQDDGGTPHQAECRHLRHWETH